MSQLHGTAVTGNAESFLHGIQSFILFGKFFHTKDCDDILQLFVTLQNLLYTTGNFVMLLTDDIRLQNTGVGFQRINAG